MKQSIKSDGGPSSYYDFPKGYTTLNDIIEDKSKTQWLEHSFHLANIMKAAFRWGDKDGTTKEYDAKKMIYSAARILRNEAGEAELRDYMEGLLNDPQFNTEKKDEIVPSSPAVSDDPYRTDRWVYAGRGERLYNQRTDGVVSYDYDLQSGGSTGFVPY